jgi:glycosyltransferase involved in cell wall biosynthesis
MKPVVIIAAYNEEKEIAKVIRRTKKAANVDIIVVNDGSKDKTSEYATKEGVIVLDHLINLGKGAALITGCDYADNKGYTHIVLVDGDGQHEPEDIPRFLKTVQKTDIVFGYRKVGDSPQVYRFGNWFLSSLSKILFGKYIYDTQCGFRAFTTKAYRQIKWKSRQYAVESEMIFRSKGLKYKQIPIKNIYDENHKGVDNGTTVFDGVKIGMQMIKWKLLGD